MNGRCSNVLMTRFERLATNRGTALHSCFGFHSSFVLWDLLRSSRLTLSAPARAIVIFPRGVVRRLGRRPFAFADAARPWSSSRRRRPRGTTRHFSGWPGSVFRRPRRKPGSCGPRGRSARRSSSSAPDRPRTSSAASCRRQRFRSRAAGWPLTITSTGTFRESPMRARSMCQYGFWSSRAWRMRSVSSVGFSSRRAATSNVTFTFPGCVEIRAG